MYVRAALLVEPYNVEVRTIESPESPPPPGMVLVGIQAVGLCGSDFHYYTAGRIGQKVINHPFILGHEAAGTVLAVGEGVHLDVASVVALEPAVPCGTCSRCRTGRYNLCSNVACLGSPPINGALRQKLVHSGSWVHPANGLTPSQACLAEPLSVAIQANREARTSLGQTVAVVGAGPIGIFTALTAEARGADVTLFDISEARMETLAEVGLSGRLIWRDDDVTDEYDVVFECSGSAAGIETATKCVKMGGIITLVGLGTKTNMMLDGLSTVMRGVTVIGSFRYANTFPAALRLLTRMAPRLRPLYAHCVTLEDLPGHLREGRYLQWPKTIVTV